MNRAALDTIRDVFYDGTALSTITFYSEEEAKNSPLIKFYVEVSDINHPQTEMTSIINLYGGFQKYQVPAQDYRKGKYLMKEFQTTKPVTMTPTIEKYLRKLFGMTEGNSQHKIFNLDVLHENILKNRQKVLNNKVREALEQNPDLINNQNFLTHIILTPGSLVNMYMGFALGNTAVKTQGAYSYYHKSILSHFTPVVNHRNRVKKHSFENRPCAPDCRFVAFLAIHSIG